MSASRLRLEGFLRREAATLEIAVDAADVPTLIGLARGRARERRVGQQIWRGLDPQRVAPPDLAELAFGIGRGVSFAPGAHGNGVALASPRCFDGDLVALLVGLGFGHLGFDATGEDGTLEDALQASTAAPLRSRVVIGNAFAPAQVAAALDAGADGFLLLPPASEDVLHGLYGTFTDRSLDHVPTLCDEPRLRRVHRLCWWRADDDRPPPDWTDAWLLPSPHYLGIGPGTIYRLGDRIGRCPARATCEPRWLEVALGTWTGFALLDALWRPEPLPCGDFRALGGAARQLLCHALETTPNAPAGDHPNGTLALTRAQRRGVQDRLEQLDWVRPTAQADPPG